MTCYYLVASDIMNKVVDKLVDQVVTTLLFRWNRAYFLMTLESYFLKAFDNFCPVMCDSRGRCSSPFPSHRASVLSEDNLPWSYGQCDLDTERCYLPTKVVPIYVSTCICMLSNR